MKDDYMLHDVSINDYEAESAAEVRSHVTFRSAFVFSASNCFTTGLFAKRQTNCGADVSSWNNFDCLQSCFAEFAYQDYSSWHLNSDAELSRAAWIKLWKPEDFSLLKRKKEKHSPTHSTMHFMWRDEGEQKVWFIHVSSVQTKHTGHHTGDEEHMEEVCRPAGWAQLHHIHLHIQPHPSWLLRK